MIGAFRGPVTGFYLVFFVGCVAAFSSRTEFLMAGRAEETLFFQLVGVFFIEKFSFLRGVARPCLQLETEVEHPPSFGGSDFFFLDPVANLISFRFFLFRRLSQCGAVFNERRNQELLVNQSARRALNEVFDGHSRLVRRALIGSEETMTSLTTNRRPFSLRVRPSPPAIPHFFYGTILDCFFCFNREKP